VKQRKWEDEDENERKWEDGSGSRSEEWWVSFRVVGVGSSSRSEISCNLFQNKLEYNK
jgi:hypothetical protein